MKKIYILVLVMCSSMVLFAQTKVTKTIEPLISSLPVVYQDDVKGGFHQVVDMATRDALPSSLKVEGMVVWVTATKTAFQWDGISWIQVFWVRNWAEGVHFVPGNVFLYNNTLVIAKSSGTIAAGDDPFTDTTNWSSLANELPDITAGTAGNVLTVNDTEDGVQWTESVPLSGDISVAETGVVTVEKIQNIAVSATAPTNGQVLTYNGTGLQWEASTATSVGVGTADYNTLYWDASSSSWIESNALTNDGFDVTIGIDATIVGDLELNGGDMTSTASTFNLLNTTVTDLAIGGVATTVTIGAATASNQLPGSVTIGTMTPDHITYDGGDLAVADDMEVDGDLWVDGVLNTPSDIRLKTKVQTLTNVLDKISRLRGVRYEFRDQQKFAAGPQIGVIAQELQREFPELVSQGADGYLAVNYSQLTGVLIQAVKEQQEEIDLLKKQMARVMEKMGLD